MSEILLGLVGAVTSLLFSYVPSLKVWLDKQANKGLIMLGFTVLIAAAYFGLVCSPFAADLSITLTCDKIGVISILQAIYVIAAGNQLTYLLTKRSSVG